MTSVSAVITPLARNAGDALARRQIINRYRLPHATKITPAKMIWTSPQMLISL